MPTEFVKVYPKSGLLIGKEGGTAATLQALSHNRGDSLRLRLPLPQARAQCLACALHCCTVQGVRHCLALPPSLAQGLPQRLTVLALTGPTEDGAACAAFLYKNSMGSGS